MTINLAHWLGHVLDSVANTAYPDLSDRLNTVEEEHEVWEPGEIVAPPATLDDIYTVLGDIHDLLVSQSSAPATADLSPTMGRVGDSPEQVEGNPLTPPCSGHLNDDDITLTSMLLRKAADALTTAQLCDPGQNWRSLIGALRERSTILDSPEEH